ncbi:ArnT family glycosyltransferase [Nocardia sp. CDC160]|uniref:ArnT family glycosyltransferase n=1 Tax=Nocardia sp. CDC160 TaxID=3112166 RepID=UPI002DB99D74|nr:glycosyltransferase family 39 protein [Nocardia sp. CDC160]MEC3920375.1 glycosyltransferase family 39 protein [Nocardia sp. CDC160]
MAGALALPVRNEIDWSRWLRGPAEQPRWARPALLAVAALAAVLYAWGIGAQTPHLYYSAAARSMSMSWHNFFYAAFDPAATISIDKLPGAIWIQALSVRIFGPHLWAYLLPQVVEGVLTVLVLYRAVRRLSGYYAALVAALVAAVAPATVALNRGNISDTLLVLLLVLAADQAAAAIVSGRARNLLYCGLCIGLAFQAKMVQAWLIVPALVAAVLVAASRSELRQRIPGLLGFGVIAAAVSLSWMSLVSLLPAGHRPYVDGSHDNSLFEQVFVYNGASRTNDGFGVGAANFTTAANQSGYRAELVLGPDNRFDHLFGGGGGRETGWLLPLALLCLVALAWAARRRPRTDRQTAALVLWGGWLLIHVIVFLVIGTVNPYYLAVLTPAIAALIGMGANAFRGSSDRRVWVLGLIGVAATAAYGWWLSAAAPGWVRAGLVIATVLIIAAAIRARATLATALLVVAALAAPTAAAVSVVVDGYGPLDTPYESAQARQVTQGFMASSIGEARKLNADLAKLPGRPRYPLLTYTTALASPFILVSGEQVPSIGGFTGASPVPTTDQVARLIESGQVGLALITPAQDDRLTWIRQHCRELPGQGDGKAIQAYNCAHH